MEFQLSMAQMIGLAAFLLFVGKQIKKRVNVLEKFFIPAPVIGGTIFSLLLLVGYQTGKFSFTFDNSIKDLFMIAFFTTVGFSASLKVLKEGGIGVVLFLLVAVLLVIIQDVVGVALAKAFSINPLLGLAAGSIPLTGGHGTSGSFGPYLESLGANGATVVAIASATYGLVSGCLLGGPIGRKLLLKHNLQSHDKEADLSASQKQESHHPVTEARVLEAVIYVGVAMGLGTTVNPYLKEAGIVLPPYLSCMVFAAILRNLAELFKRPVPFNEMCIVGNVCLSMFLSMALMTMKLWELSGLAIPLIVILLIQTVIMGLFAYYVTFNLMGRNYDAAVMACGHCGFGLGATPNAMANMETFTAANGPSIKSFFVIPLVGSLFIDFCNAGIITVFANFILKHLS